MKKLLICGLSLLATQLFAGDKIDKTLDVESQGVVEIHNTRGEIVVMGWEKSQVQVKGTLDDLAESFVFETKNGATLIKVKLPRDTSFRSRDGSKLNIMVPESSRVTFAGVATDLNISKIQNGLELNSVSGDMVIKNIEGRTYINNVSGKVELKTVKGPLEVSTVSGDLYAEVESQKLVIGGVSADMTIRTSTFDSASISTVSGDAKLFGSISEDGELKMSSVSGEALFFVKGELNARISMETAPGGEVINEYSEDKPLTNFIGSQSLRFTTGSGAGEIRMSTVSGDIGLKRKTD